MEVVIDHYLVLGLPSGEEGSKLTDVEIIKAYKSKALELHPDKRPDEPNAKTEFQRLKSSYEILKDEPNAKTEFQRLKSSYEILKDEPNAKTEFQRLKSSYEILKDEEARKDFDDVLRKKRYHLQRQSRCNAKRQKMMSDLDVRERASFAPDQTSNAREEERIANKLKEEIAGIQAMQSTLAATSKTTSTTTNVLKVSWEGDSEDYNAQRLRELFMKFGDVEDVVVRSKGSKRKKKIGSAFVVMTSKDGAVAAMKGFLGDLSNPLCVLPLHRTPLTDQFTTVPPANKYEEPIEAMLKDLIGAGYQAKEDSILQKLLKKAAEKQK